MGSVVNEQELFIKLYVEPQASCSHFLCFTFQRQHKNINRLNVMLIERSAPPFSNKKVESD